MCNTIVINKNPVASLNSYRIDVNTHSSPTIRNIIVASRGGITNFGQTVVQTMNELSGFGQAILNDYFSNPFNVADAAIIGYTCGVGQAVPVGGQAACVGALTKFGISITVSAAKVAINRLIDVSNYSDFQKTQYKDFVNSSTLVIGISQINPNEGFVIPALGSVYDLMSPTVNMLFENGNVKGGNITARLSGTDNAINFVFQQVTPKLDLSQSSTSPSSSVGGTSLGVTSNVSWTASSNASWCTVTPSSGSNNGTLSVNWSTNTSSTSRPATITVIGGGITRTFSVNQSGVVGCTDSYESNNSFSAASYLAYSGSGTFVSSEACIGFLGDNDYYRFVIGGKNYYAQVKHYNNATFGGSYSLAITLNNGIITVRTQPISGKQTIDTYLYLYNENQAFLVSDDDSGGNNYSVLSYTIAVPTLTLSQSSTSPSSSVGNTSLGVTSNVSWTASSNAAWCTVTPSNGSNNSTLSVNWSANTGSTSRPATITVSGGGLTRTFTVSQSGTVGCTDYYESNNSFSAASYLAYSGSGTFVSSEACIGFLGDNDYYRFIIGGKNYYAQVKHYNNATFGGSYSLAVTLNGSTLTVRTQAIINKQITDTHLFLYNESQVLLTSDDDSGGNNYSVLSYIIPSTVTSNLILSQGSATTTALGGGTSVNVTSNVSWTASSNALWCSVSPSSGSNNGTLSVNWSANIGTSQRPATVTVSGGGITRYFYVTQAGASVSSYLDLSQSSNAPSSLGGGTSVNVSSNVFWTASTNASWCSLSPSSGNNNGTLSVNWSANTGISQRAATITVTGGGFTRYFYVTQAGAVVVTPSNDEPCNAINITPSSTESYITGATISATTTTSAANPTCATATNDVWYKFVVPSSGNFTIVTKSGSMTDAIVGIYAGTCSSLSGGNNSLCKDDNTDGTRMPVVPVSGFSAYAGSTLYIRIWGYGSTTGTFTIGVLNYYSTTTYNLVVNNSNKGQVQATRKSIQVIDDNSIANDLLAINQTPKMFENKQSPTRQMNVYPNPAKSILNLDYSVSSDGQVEMTLLNVTGQVMKQSKGMGNSGTNTLSIGVDDLQTGFYFLKLQTVDGLKIEKVQIQH